ncbi:MAG: phosphoenolpyruvate--protein phosphotransferase [bacterium]|nr:phosphoenolpyruvate--protein phosphotransferase [bacterium]
MSEQLILKAPVSGATVAIEDVPDPVFASKMVGDGLSIDPTSPFLLAPCSGKVLQIHPSCHALTIKSPQGPEILMHVGLDTVSLKGEGFKPLVSQGDEVVAGDRLLEFDADLIACKSRSLLTEILVTNLELVDSLEVTHGDAVAGKTTVLTVNLREDFSTPQQKPDSSSEQFVYSPPIVVRNLQGIHARPAATLVNSAKRFKSRIELLRGAQSANCKSVVAIMALQVECGDTVKLQASGPDKDEAIKELTVAIRNGLGEAVGAVPDQTANTNGAPDSASAAPIEDGVYKGIAASPGLALGQVYQMKRHEWEVPEKGGTPTQERQLLDRVVGQAQSELEKLEQQTAKDASKEKAAIFAAHRELLNDPDLVDNAHAKILQGFSAAYAWKESFTEQAQRLSALKQKMLAARATDVRDVGERVLRLLLGKEAETQEMPENTIVIAEELTPSDTASLDRSKVLGFATVLGGGTSHAAILARSLDLPAIAGINPKALELPNGHQVLLNGDKGTLDTDISEAEMSDIRQRLAKQKELKRLYQEHASRPAVTTDGHRVQVAANIGSIDDAKQAMSLGAEGVGLLRSEFLFMNRPTPPGEDEQAHIYRAIALAVGRDNPLIIRTLDVGGDKPLPYLPVPKEDNPFLGERGLRLCLNRPELLRTQFRAILRAAELAKVMVMLPMVTSIEEFRQAKEMFQEEQNALGVKGVPLGVMIEVPSAALTAASLAREAEFFSIGTNDLTQYTLAIDRGHPKLAAQADGLSPAVLRLIQMTAEGGHAHQRQVGICGGLGGELAAVPILVGLGIDELSVAAPAIGAVKYTIRQLSYEECRALADKALGCENAAKVREMLEAQK